MRTRPQICITLDKKLLFKIDNARGLISRSKYIEKLLKEALVEEK